MQLFSPETLIIAAPAQNREGYETTLERAVPMLGVRALNSIKNLKLTSHPQYELWNNYGAKMDAGYEMFGGDQSRAEYSKNLLQQRYEFMTNNNVISDEESIMLLCDDDDEYNSWMRNKIESLVDQGVMYIDKELMVVCNDCSVTLCVATERSRGLRCHECQCNQTHQENREGVFMNIQGYIPQIILPKKSIHIAKQVNNLPTRVLVERNRDYGLSLDFIERQDYKLDPKISLALFPEYLSEQTGRKNIAIIQGTQTLYNTAPYTSAMSPDLNVGYILSANMPQGTDIDYVERLGVRFFSRYLSLYLIDRTTAVDEVHLQELQKEYTRTCKNYRSALRNNIPYGDGEHDDEAMLVAREVQNSLDMIGRAEVRSGVLSLRNTIMRRLGGVCYDYVDRPRYGKFSMKSQIDKIYEQLV